jgi:hypothetical protein
MAGFGINEGIGLAGGIANLFGGASANKAKKEMLRSQKRIADTQLQTYKATQPSYLQAIQALQQRAGIGGYGDTNDPYGQNQVDRLQAQQVEQEIARRQQQQQNALGFRLGSQGISQGTVGSALARNQLAGQNQYADFRRQQLIAAPQLQQQRIQALLAALGPGLGSASGAANIYGGQAGLYSGEEGQAAAGLSGLIQNYQLMKYLGQQGGGGAQTAQMPGTPWGGPGQHMGPPNQQIDMNEIYRMFGTAR